MDRTELERKRDRLSDRLAPIRRELDSGLDRHLEYQAQQFENRDSLLEIARVTEQELRGVEVQLSDPGDS